MFRWPVFLVLCAGLFSLGSRQVYGVDSGASEDGGVPPGPGKQGGACLDYNEKTLRLEVRDEAGTLLAEISPGSVKQTVSAAGQEYLLSFGKDEMGRPSVIIRAGPAMRRPLAVKIFGRQAVLSPEASLTATLAGGRQVFFDPSLSGNVYFPDPTDRGQAK